MAVIDANTTDQWLTLGQASKLLGVHPATLRQWSDEGKVSLFRTPGGHRRFARPEIERMLHVLPVRGPGLSAFVATETVQRTRQELDAAHGQQSWMQHLDVEQREQWRSAGRQAVALLASLINREPSEAQRATALSVGQTYGSLLLRAGLNLPDAVMTFLFFRDAMLETIFALPTTTGLDRDATLSSLHRINSLLHEMLRAMMTVWDMERQQ